MPFRPVLALLVLVGCFAAYPLEASTPRTSAARSSDLRRGSEPAETIHVGRIALLSMYGMLDEQLAAASLRFHSLAIPPADCAPLEDAFRTLRAAVRDGLDVSAVVQDRQLATLTVQLAPLLSAKISALRLRTEIAFVRRHTDELAARRDALPPDPELDERFGALFDGDAALAAAGRVLAELEAPAALLAQGSELSALYDAYLENVVAISARMMELQGEGSPAPSSGTD